MPVLVNIPEENNNWKRVKDETIKLLDTIASSFDFPICVNFARTMPSITCPILVNLFRYPVVYDHLVAENAIIPNNGKIKYTAFIRAVGDNTIDSYMKTLLAPHNHTLFEKMMENAFSVVRVAFRPVGYDVDVPIVLARLYSQQSPKWIIRAIVPFYARGDNIIDLPLLQAVMPAILHTLMAIFKTQQLRELFFGDLAEKPEGYDIANDPAPGERGRLEEEILVSASLYDVVKKLVATLQPPETTDYFTYNTLKMTCRPDNTNGVIDKIYAEINPTQIYFRIDTPNGIPLRVMHGPDNVDWVPAPGTEARVNFKEIHGVLEADGDMYRQRDPTRSIYVVYKGDGEVVFKNNEKVWTGVHNNAGDPREGINIAGHHIPEGQRFCTGDFLARISRQDVAPIGGTLDVDRVCQNLLRRVALPIIDIIARPNWTHVMSKSFPRRYIDEMLRLGVLQERHSKDWGSEWKVDWQVEG